MDFLDGEKPAVALVEGLVAAGEELATTCVNVAELHRGVDAGDVALQALLDRLLELPLDAAAARRAGAVLRALDKAGRPMPEMDALIAAIALEHGGRLATRNRRHFRRVAGLQLVPR